MTNIFIFAKNAIVESKIGTDATFESKISTVTTIEPKISTVAMFEYRVIGQKVCLASRLHAGTGCGYHDYIRRRLFLDSI